MKKIIFIIISGLLFFSFVSEKKVMLEKDIYKTNNGNLSITFVGHSSLIFEYNKIVIHVDPFSGVADYGKLLKADLILITHHHGDHLDSRAIDLIKKKDTQIVATEKCTEKIKAFRIMKNGASWEYKGINIEAVPAYNILHKRKDGTPFHVKGEGNGYVVAFGNKNVYIAGDTENIPEMKNLKNIDIAFLPMNLPYTMTEEMAADAAGLFNPAILYPYHYRGSDREKLKKLLKGNKDIKIILRDLYKGYKKK